MKITDDIPHMISNNLYVLKNTRIMMILLRRGFMKMEKRVRNLRRKCLFSPLYLLSFCDSSSSLLALQYYVIVFHITLEEKAEPISTKSSSRGSLDSSCSSASNGTVCLSIRPCNKRKVLVETVSVICDVDLDCAKETTYGRNITN